MPNHVPASNVTKNALGDSLGAKFQNTGNGKPYTVTGFHPGLLVMKDSDGNWYDAVQYVEFHEGDDQARMVFIRRADEFAAEFERVVEG